MGNRRKIEVGDYVRIKQMYNEQKIAKIEAILDKDACYKNMQMYRIDNIHQKSNGHFPSYEIYKEDIIKHSKNIIDLIEVGDFVNGEKVYSRCDSKLWLDGDEGEILIVDGEPDEPIISIVTKEQFANIEYRLGE